jgi:hypothetical protein
MLIPVCFSLLLRLQSFWPHVVLRPFPDGTCVKLYETWSPLLSVFSKNKPRGNTPVRGYT